MQASDLLVSRSVPVEPRFPDIKTQKLFGRVLPFDVLRLIFQHLNLQDFKRLASANTTWEWAFKKWRIFGVKNDLGLKFQVIQKHFASTTSHPFDNEHLNRLMSPVSFSSLLNEMNEWMLEIYKWSKLPANSSACSRVEEVLYPPSPFYLTPFLYAAVTRNIPTLMSMSVFLSKEGIENHPLMTKVSYQHFLDTLRIFRMPEDATESIHLELIEFITRNAKQVVAQKFRVSKIPSPYVKMQCIRIFQEKISCHNPRPIFLRCTEAEQTILISHTLTHYREKPSLNLEKLLSFYKSIDSDLYSRERTYFADDQSCLSFTKKHNITVFVVAVLFLLTTLLCLIRKQHTVFTALSALGNGAAFSSATTVFFMFLYYQYKDKQKKALLAFSP